MGYLSHPPPPEFQLAFHIYYVKYENIFTCKRISWNSGGGGGGGLGNDVLKIFSISHMFDTKSDHFSPQKSCTFMDIGNQMQNHKIETNSKLIYEDGII